MAATVQQQPVWATPAIPVSNKQEEDEEIEQVFFCFYFFVFCLFCFVLFLFFFFLVFILFYFILFFFFWGGDIGLFIHCWKEVTSDVAVLDTIEGVMSEFQKYSQQKLTPKS